MATIEKRRTASGATAWRTRVRLHGFPEHSATFGRRADALAWARRTEGALLERRYFPERVSLGHTVADLVDRYIREVCPHKPGGPRLASQLAWWRGTLGTFALGTLTAHDVAAARDKLGTTPTRTQQRRSGATLNRYLAALSHAFTLAIRWGWARSNPIRDVARLPEPRRPPSLLDDDELRRLHVACLDTHPDLWPIVHLALATGMRKGELARLTLDDIDLHHQRLHVRQTKNGRPRSVHLPGPVVYVVRKRLDATTPTTALFTMRSAFETRWRRARNAASLGHVRFHDLRHCAATALADAGATVPQLAAFLGHRTFTMAERYVTLQSIHVADRVDRMAASLALALDADDAASPLSPRTPGAP